MCGRVLGEFELGFKLLRGWCAALLVLLVERVVRLLGVERLFHVKHMLMGLVSVSVAASRLRRRLIL